MKASAAVLTSFQKPLTVFGMPFKMGAMAFGAPVPVLAVSVLIQKVVYGYISWLVLTVLALVWVWRRNRENYHFETLTLLPGQFWKGKNRRPLLAGGVPAKKGRGRKR